MAKFLLCQCDTSLLWITPTTELKQAFPRVSPHKHALDFTPKVKPSSPVFHSALILDACCRLALLQNINNPLVSVNLYPVSGLDLG